MIIYYTKSIQISIKIQISRIRLSSRCLNIKTGRYQGNSREAWWSLWYSTNWKWVSFYYSMSKILQSAIKIYINEYYLKPPSKFNYMYFSCWVQNTYLAWLALLNISNMLYISVIIIFHTACNSFSVFNLKLENDKITGKYKRRSPFPPGQKKLSLGPHWKKTVSAHVW